MTRTETPWDPWEPAALADVAALFSSVEVDWWVAGGYAIELAVGHSFREHGDIDVLSLQTMLDEAEGPDWIPRRCAQVRRPIDLLGRKSPESVPYLAPEVRLFYKASQPRPKDEEDFQAVLPVLDAGQREWLAAAITQAYGDRPWCEQLR